MRYGPRRTSHEPETPLDTDAELGPIDYLLVEFPGDDVASELGPLIRELIDGGVVRLLDLVFIRKAADGTVTVTEIGDVEQEQSATLTALIDDVADLVGEDDIAAAAEAMEPGTAAGLLVWENTWAAPFANALRRAGGQIVSTGRIPLADVLAAMDASASADES